jgi:hypothetical protein
MKQTSRNNYRTGTGSTARLSFGPNGKSPTQREKILNLLRQSGRAGAFNSDLVGIAYRYSSRLREICQMGFEVSTRYVREGVFKYVLEREPQVVKALPDFQPRPVAATTPVLFPPANGPQRRTG